MHANDTPLVTLFGRTPLEEHLRVRLWATTTTECRCTKTACSKPWQVRGRSFIRPKRKLEQNELRCVNNTKIGRNNGTTTMLTATGKATTSHLLICLLNAFNKTMKLMKSN